MSVCADHPLAGQKQVPSAASASGDEHFLVGLFVCFVLLVWGREGETNNFSTRLLFLFYRWGNRGPESLKRLPITSGDGTGTQIQLGRRQ